MLRAHQQRKRKHVGPRGGKKDAYVIQGQLGEEGRWGVGSLAERVVFPPGGGLVEEGDGGTCRGAGPVAAKLEGVELEGRSVGVGRVEKDGEGGRAGEFAARKVVFDKDASGRRSGRRGRRRVLANVGGAGGADGVEGEVGGVSVELYCPWGMLLVGRGPH